jgi:ABC-type antimicrobial peptide transport system permease subunit
MYLKHTLKYCLRAPLRFFLFVIIISLTTFLLIIQFCIYEKGNDELIRTREAYKVVGDVSLIEDNVEDLSSQYNYQLTDEDIAILIESPYIRLVDFRFDLFSKINGLNRISNQSFDMSDELYFQGHVLNKKIDDKTFTVENWKLEVSVDKIYYAQEDPGKIITLFIPVDDETFDYDKLFSGASYFFSHISVSSTYLNKSQYSLLYKPFDRYIISEEGAKLTPDDYEYQLNFAKSLKAAIDVFPITYTNDLLSIPDFFNDIASISQGRSFSIDEYERGDMVCIISQELASKGAIKIGDTLKLSVTDEFAYNEFRSGGSFNPFFINASFEPEASYKVIGFYKTKNNNLDDPQYFTVNTIFVPLKSCPKKLSPDSFDKVYYTFKTSFVLSSPDKKYELLNNLKDKNFNFDKFNITVYDQGYELIRMILKNMMDSSISLLLITSITIILVLALLVYLYMVKRKREFAIMRVMGETKHKASLIFYLGILFISILGTFVGAISAAMISEQQVKRAYEVGQKAAIEEGVEGGSYSDTYVFDSGIPITYLVLPVFGIFMILLLFCFLGYLQFRKKALLQFISVRAET